MVSFVFLVYKPYMYLLVRARFLLRVTVCWDTITESILVVAIIDAVDLTTVMASQAAVFLNAVMIDISC